MDQFCWEIIQCNDRDSCPARLQAGKPCWEVMAEHDSFQCQYGLCEDCIVYISKSNNTLFSKEEIEEVWYKRRIANGVC